MPQPLRVRRLVAADPADPATRQAAEAFAAAALAGGQEGVVVKALDAPYTAGRRQASWLKVKPVHTLDLVVLAAEWGHGRRAGRLSNLHLGARRADGSFAMLGKTFKGLTDALLDRQTEQLARLAVERPAWGVRVRPELVVEIAFDGVQRSTRYPEGHAALCPGAALPRGQAGRRGGHGRGGAGAASGRSLRNPGDPEISD